jgi:four helix bundle protein
MITIENLNFFNLPQFSIPNSLKTMDGSKIQSSKDLRVWQEGMNLAEACHQLTKTFLKEQMYAMTSQIRRFAASIPANIAEGYSREYRAQYIQFLRIAQGSLKELETHFLLSARVTLTPTNIVNPILEQCASLSRMLRSLIRTLQNKS